MKLLRVPGFLIIVFFISCNSAERKGANGIVYKNAQEYNDYIVSRQSKIINYILDFVKAADTDIDSAEVLLDNGISSINTSITDIKGMSDFKGDSSLRNAAINSFVFYKDVFGNEYKKLLMIRKKGGDITEDDQVDMKSIIEKITREEEKYDVAFHNAQREFAKHNNMQLKENELQNKINKMDK